jgi:hypothetical protein
MLHIVYKKLIIVASLFLFSWVVGTFLIHRFEAGHPIGESYFNAFYFTVITTATIGFGDFVPKTDAGKWLTMGYAVFYVPLFLYVMTVLFQSSLHKVRQIDERIEAEMKNVEKDVELILGEVTTKEYTAPATKNHVSPPEKKRRLIAKK